MGKRGSIGFKVLLGFLVLVVLTVAAAYLFLNPIAKKAVEAKAGPLFDNRLQFGGVGISIPARSIVVKEIVLQQPPGFGSGNLLTVKEVYLQVAVLPLLHKKVVVKSLIIRNPEIKLVQTSDGKTNLEYYFAGLAKKGSSAGPSKFKFHLDNFSVRDAGAVIYSPQLSRKSPALEISGLNLLFDDLNFPNQEKTASPFRVDAAITAAHPVSLSGKGKITLGAGPLDFDAVTEIKGIELADFTYLFPDTKVSVSSGQVNVKAISQCRQNYLDSNQHVEIRSLKLTGKGGFLGNTVLGLPSAAVVKFLSDKQGVLALDFKVTGQIDTLKANLKESVGSAFSRSFRDNFGGSIMGIGRGIGTSVQRIGEGLNDTGKGLFSPLRKILPK